MVFDKIKATSCLSRDTILTTVHSKIWEPWFVTKYKPRLALAETLFSPQSTPRYVSHGLWQIKVNAFFLFFMNKRSLTTAELIYSSHSFWDKIKVTYRSIWYTSIEEATDRKEGKGRHCWLGDILECRTSHIPACSSKYDLNKSFWKYIHFGRVVV